MFGTVLPRRARPTGPDRGGLLRRPIGQALGLCHDDPVTADGITDAIDQLAEQGPSLSRPLVHRIQGSTFHNMKELRPPSAGTSEIRMLFVFDPGREAIFLLAGDKAGNWSRWYRIPIADRRLTEHLAALKEASNEHRVHLLDRG